MNEVMQDSRLHKEVYYKNTFNENKNGDKRHSEARKNASKTLAKGIKKEPKTLPCLKNNLFKFVQNWETLGNNQLGRTEQDKEKD